jgi:hypothetical protein
VCRSLAEQRISGVGGGAGNSKMLGGYDLPRAVLLIFRHFENSYYQWGGGCLPGVDWCGVWGGGFASWRKSGRRGLVGGEGGRSGVSFEKARNGHETTLQSKTPILCSLAVHDA